MSIPFFTTKDYIIRAMGLLGLFRVLKRAHATNIGAPIAGVKLGDRVLLAGASDIALAAEIAITAGLTGRVVAVAPTTAGAQQIAASVEAAGGLVEPLGAPLTMLPLDAAAFDLAIAEGTLLALAESDRRAALAGIFRVLRPGGRLVWIERAHAQPPHAARERMLTDAGFRAARVLADVEGKTYLEGTKAASA